MLGEYGYKEILGFITCLWVIPQAYITIKSILAGKTKPHVYTRIIWLVLTSIAFIIQYNGGGGPGTWVLGGTSLTHIIILLLCIKYGSRDITRFDTGLLIAALFCIPLYLGIDDKMYALLFVIFIDFLGYIPTYRKTFNDPHSEDLIVWLLTTGKYVIAIFALTVYSVETLAYLLFLIVGNGILIYLIICRRNVIKEGKYKP